MVVTNRSLFLFATDNLTSNLANSPVKQYIWQVDHYQRHHFISFIAPKSAVSCCLGYCQLTAISTSGEIDVPTPSI